MARRKKVEIDPIENLPGNSTEVELTQPEVHVEEPIQEDIALTLMEDASMDAEIEEEQKKYYANLMTDPKVKSVQDKLVSGAANTFAAMSSTDLIIMVDRYEHFPFSYEPKVADALAFELSKRGMKDKYKTFTALLPTLDWYSKPWSRY